MEKILFGLVYSDHPASIKRDLLTKIANHGKQKDVDKALFNNILKTCLGVVFNEKTEIELNSIIKDLLYNIITVWVQHNEKCCIEFLKLHYLDEPLQMYDKDNQIIQLDQLRFLLNLYYSIPNKNKQQSLVLTSALKHYLQTSLLKADDIIILGLLCSICAKHPFLVPQNLTLETSDAVFGVFVKIFSITPLSYFLKAQSRPEHEYIGDLLSTLIADNDNAMIVFGNHIFKYLYKGDKPPSPCIVKLLPYLKLELLSSSIEKLMKVNISDDTHAKILSSMMDWIVIPDSLSTVDEWIIFYMKCLIKYTKYQELFLVIESKIKQTFHYMFFPTLRKNAMSLTIFMLMSYQHSPKAFHQICGIIPNLVAHLKKESTTDSNGALIQTIADLAYTLVHHFPGYPDLYDSLLDALKGYTVPSEEKIKNWLQESLSLPTVDRSSFISVPQEQKSSTGKVGLINLGNTCYANSIIQALFNLKKIKKLLLEDDHTTSVEIRALTTSFRELFALLHLSKRTAIAPSAFLELSRPPWFQKGFQQDCSEYLKFLLDKLQDESLSDASCDINKLVTGTLKTRVVCSQCGNHSEREELFNDLPLSFHDVTYGNVDVTLKGGDPSDILKRKMDSALNNCVNKLAVETSSENNDSPISTPQSSGGNGGGESSQLTEYSIHEMFHNYLTPEHLNESNQYFCEQCGALQNALKTIDITEFPAYLILTIKRFTYNVATQKRSKLLHVVQHPQLFSICGGCIECRENKGSTTKHSSMTMNIDVEVDQRSPTHHCKNLQHFRLSSFVVHSGYSSESGHYYSYVCEYQDDEHQTLGTKPPTPQWFLMNDSRVTSASLKSIESLATSFPSDTPYIYIYERYVPGQSSTSSDFTMKGRLLDYVQNDDAIFEMELQKEAVKRQNSFLCSRDDKPNGDGDDDNGGGGSFNGGGNCGGSLMPDNVSSNFIY